MCYLGVLLQRSAQSGGYESQQRLESFLLPSHPLLEYALRWGFEHLAYVDPRNRIILHAIKDFQSDAEQHDLVWKQLCEEAFFSDIPRLALKHDLVFAILIAFAPEPLLRLFIGLGRAKLQLKDGTNPLIYAARCEKIEQAKTLLAKGANVNCKGWDIQESRQVLPLEVAVRSGDRAMVDLFLAEGSHVPHKLFVDALMTNSSCFLGGHIVSRLLQTDEFVEWAIEVQDEETLLRALDQNRYMTYGGLSEKDIDVIERRLVQLGYKPPPRLDEASLRSAVSGGHVSTVRRMLSLKIPCPPDIVLDASRSRHSNSTMIRIFLDMGCNVNVTSPIGDTPLHLVLQSLISKEDCFESVQLLVDAGCNPSAPNLAGDTPIHLAAEHIYVSVVEYLLSLRVPLPPDILLVTLEPALVRLLIRHGADVHAIAANGNTTLHSVMRPAWINKDDPLDCAGILVDAGCNPRSPNASGKTVFDVAAEMGHVPVVQYLLSINVPLPPAVLLPVVSGSHATPMIKLLIDKGANVRATRLNGDTLLHLVMDMIPEAECLKRIKILVNAGCDPRAHNVRGRTPFHFATRQGYVYVMEYLLSLRIPVPSDVMLTVFERPTRPTFYPTTRFLLNKGGDVHTISETGDTLLHLAAKLEPEHDALEFTKFLVQAGCNPSISNSQNKTPLHVAARNGYISLIDYYLSLGTSLPPDILFVAVTGWSSEVIRYLIEQGADASAGTTDGDTPLHLLVTKGGCVESIKILVRIGCDPRAQNLAGETPLHVAARHGSISVLKYFISQGVPLPHDILRTSASSTFRFLISKGVDVRCVAANVDMQLLHRALDFRNEMDCLECAKILVGAGWDPSLRNSVGQTPIHIAARHGHISIIQYLLSQSATLPPDTLLTAIPRNQFLDTSPTGRVPLIRFLIGEGASVNAATPDGDTPLHLVLRSRFILDEDREFEQMELWKVVEILLNCGADPSARNADGQTPFDTAEANGHFFKENFLRLVRNAQRIRSSSYSTSVSSTSG